MIRALLYPISYSDGFSPCIPESTQTNYVMDKVMAEETRKSREKMDDILRDIINQWDGYEVVE